MTSVMSFSLEKDNYIIKTIVETNETDVQHPGETTVKISIDALKISQRDLLGKDHLVECGHEVRIQEATV